MAVTRSMMKGRVIGKHAQSDWVLEWVVMFYKLKLCLCKFNLYECIIQFTSNYHIIPIFHQETRSRWLLNANKNETNEMKLTCTVQAQPWRTQRTLYYSARWFMRVQRGLRTLVHWAFWIPTCWYLGIGNMNSRS